jgi:acyl-CoA synthetase (AMP-forming)/AMP-acid ligase II
MNGGFVSQTSTYVLSVADSDRLRLMLGRLSSDPAGGFIAACALVLFGWQGRAPAGLGWQRSGLAEETPLAVEVTDDTRFGDLVTGISSGPGAGRPTAGSAGTIRVHGEFSPSRESAALFIEIDAQGAAWSARVRRTEGISAADTAEFTDQVGTVLRHATPELSAPDLLGMLAVSPSAARPAGKTAGHPAARSTTALIRQRAAAADSGRIALADSGGRVSYAELDLLAEASARTLESAALGGRPVALTARRSRDFLIELLACRRAGTVAVLIDEGWPAARRQTAAESIGAVAEFTVGGLRPIAGGRGIRAADQALLRLLSPASHVLFTSGSTGDPVATIVGADAFDRALQRQAGISGIGVEDRVSFLSAPAHDPALRDLLMPLRGGAAVCIPPAATAGNAQRVAEWLQAERVTVMHATPVLLRLLADVPGILLPSLRLIVSSGAPLGSRLARELSAIAPAARLVNGYGCTETPQLVTACTFSADRLPAGAGSVPLGAALPGCRVEVRGPGGAITPTGLRGEIWVAEPAIALGYWPPAARTGFCTDDAGLSWFRTGDLARRDAAGALHFQGRLDRQVSVYDTRVELDEIEAVARTHPGVLDAHAAPVRDHDADHVQLWVRGAAGKPTAEQVRAHLATRIPGQAVPFRIAVVDQLGWTTRMKPAPPPEDAPGLPGVHGNQAMPSRVSARTVGALADLARGCAEQLVGRRIGDEENFFDAGFNSLLLLQFAAVLEEELELPVVPLALFRYPNLAALGPHLHSLTTTEARPSDES